MMSTEKLYFLLIVAFAGLCILFLSGYQRYKGRHEMILYFLGSTLIGIAFINISAVKPADINIFVIFIWLIIHLIVSWLIVEGSARYFFLREDKNQRRESDIIKEDPDKWFRQL